MKTACTPVFPGKAVVLFSEYKDKTVECFVTAAFPGTRHFWIPVLLSLVWVGILPAQMPLNGRLHYSACGTGRTTGHIATINIYNPTPGAIRTTAGDCFIPSDKDYQAYVVPDIYPVEVGPFGSVSIPLEGYCVNAHRPPVPDGETMTDVSRWVSWAGGDPLPAPGQAPGADFARMPAAPLGDPLALTYPGSNEPFLFTIDFNRHPRAAARLLLHAVYAAEKAYDALTGEGKMRVAAGRRAEIVQQALWAYAARLEGRNYNKAVFKAQFTEEAEQNLNLPQTAFSAETKQQAEQVAADFWAGIELVGASAKLVAPRTDRTNEPFKETPVGPPAAAANLLPDLLGKIDPEQRTAGNNLIPLLLFFQNNTATPAFRALQQSAVQKWERYLRQRLARTDPETSGALPELLELAGLLKAGASRDIGQPVFQELFNGLTEKLNSHVRYTAESLNTGDPAYIDKWRRLKSWPASHWYRSWCAAANPLQKLPLNIPANVLKTRAPGPINFSGISLANAQWKYLFPVTVAAEPRKFPWWIPVAGIPVLGGGLYFLLRDKDGGETPVPDPPLTMPDAVSLPCGNMTELNVLANDSGDGIALVAVSGTPGISVSLMDQQQVLVISAGDGVFTVNYTIRDKSGRMATGAVVITVADLSPPDISCPPAVTLEGCGQLPAPAPALSGQAGATDDCDPAPAIHFADEPAGTPCNRIFVRTWTASDNSGKAASCTQTITVKDQSPPVFSLCPPAVTVAHGQQNNPALTGQAAAADACTGPLTPAFSDNAGGVVFCAGPIHRFWTATDACGNTASCLQTVTIFDGTPPAIICPANQTVECADDLNTGITGVPQANDDCPDFIGSNLARSDDPPGFDGCSGTVTRTWTVQDLGGNTAVCTQVIEVKDQIPPAFTLCPPAVTVSLGQQNDLNLTGKATAVDHCDPAPADPVFSDDLSGLGDCGGVILRTWTATDPCDNAATCEQIITVKDATPPQIGCPAAVSVECGKQNDLNLTGKADAKDDCAGTLNAVFTDAPPAFHACSGTILRTWSAADPGGNSVSCVQEITVTDKSSPVFTFCPPALGVPCGQQNDLNITGMAQAQDACNGASSPSFTNNNSGFNGCSGVVVRTFLTADSCGNTATCQQSITVFDHTPPVFTNCPPPVFADCGQQNVLEITGQATASDACSGPASVSFTDNTDGFFACEGLIIRNWIAADQCGNTALCMQYITVSDAPCNFTPLFAIGNATCGNCNGSVSTTVNPPGQYAFQWDNGAAGPNLSGLCPGQFSVSITDQINHCTDIYSVFIEDIQIGLTLEVVSIVPPSSPSANDGRVVLRVITPGAVSPFLVFVNGTPIGVANTTTFTITNMPAGYYEIWVVDNGGQGCMSNVLGIELFPQGPPGVAGRLEMYLPPGPTGRMPALATAPEQPGGAPAQAPVLWNPPLVAAFGLNLGNSWQLRWAFGRQSGFSTDPVTPFSLQTSLYAAGLRRYFQAGKHWAFFQETMIDLNRIRADYPGGPGSDLNGDCWRAGAGGGLRLRMSGGYALDWETRVFFQPAGAICSDSPALGFGSQIQITVPLADNAGPRISRTLETLRLK